MQSNEPDSYYGESEEEYLARKREESNATGGLMAGLFALLLFCVKIFVIYGAFIYAGFLLARKFLGSESDKVKILGCTIVFTYLIFCVIYFFKGTIIGFRAKNRNIWILPWIVCILVCCLTPAFIVSGFVAALFSPAHYDNIWYKIISWGSFIISALCVYNIYAFKTPSAPIFLSWSYKLGVKLTS
ncbi:hypothetical protein DRF60_13240 [Chryseobacterium elymi]|uniref:Uncharacterized protein n=1 Tax=Chryseobacterium elymi TaxID=395936 RepID=A0A3D9DG91_9FLAO|nr:hypothetical protein [Chryseobacterium elymi]REC76841.1 hypothetical protein DRF60_13240 [Chryseobacterium elymi]